jgi:hypothetical protein
MDHAGGPGNVCGDITMRTPVTLIVAFLLMTSSGQANFLEDLSRQVLPDVTGQSALDNSAISESLIVNRAIILPIVPI